MPLTGVDPKTLKDTFSESRDGRKHEALDIMAPRGTPVLAVAEGNVAKLFNSKQGGLTVYQFDDSQQYAYYYAHLDHYAPNLKEGMLLRKGDTLGYVGSTGDAKPDAPHLHFAVFQLGPEKQWWKGTPLNPLPMLKPSAGSEGDRADAAR
jgi:murein DD-endopeptidase MepM/ murein hydrolase activator NlpD